MKWSPAYGELGKWRLERYRPIPELTDVRAGHPAFKEHIASVERVGPDLASPAQYRAEVAKRGDPEGNWMWKPQYAFRPCPTLFASLREAQLWCEREVRLMEVGELM